MNEVKSSNIKTAYDQNLVVDESSDVYKAELARRFEEQSKGN